MNSISSCIARVRTSDIIKSYKKLDINVEHFFRGIDFLDLLEDEYGLRMWHPVIPGDNDFYDALSRKFPWYYQSFRPEFALAKNVIEEHSSVLEIGSGYGFFAKYLNASDYLGLELNSQAVKICRSEGLNVANITLSQHSVLNPDSADYVVAFQLLEHLDDPSSFFQSIANILKKDGYLLLSVPAEDSFSGLIQRGWMNSPPHHLSRWSDHALELFPAQFGFKLDSLIHIPLEDINHRWFISTFLETLFDRSFYLRNTKTNIIARIKSRFLMFLISLLGGSFTVRDHFSIRGQSVFAVYRISSSTL